MYGAPLEVLRVRCVLLVETALELLDGAVVVLLHEASLLREPGARVIDAVLE
jgi:hypothetical protein